MKRFFCAILIATIALFVSGCNGYNNSDDGRMTCIYNNGFALIWMDNETGVQYLRLGEGVTALLNPDGTPYTGEWDGNE